MSSVVTIGGITAPDSEIARKAAVFAQTAYTAVLLNQVHRTYWFAEFPARKREMKFDREIVYIASRLHP